MQAVRPHRIIPFLLLLAGLVVLTAGCRANKVDWKSRVGSYTFDQAVAELGPPDRQATVTDGSRVADWILRRGGIRRVDIGYYYGGGPYGYGPAYPAYLDHYVPDYILRLTFDPSGHLKEWRKLAR